MSGGIVFTMYENVIVLIGCLSHCATSTGRTSPQFPSSLHVFIIIVSLIHLQILANGTGSSTPHCPGVCVHAPVMSRSYAFDKRVSDLPFFAPFAEQPSLIVISFLLPEYFPIIFS